MSFYVEFGGKEIKSRCVLKFPNQNYSLNWFRNRLKNNTNFNNLKIKISLIQIDLEDNKKHLENDIFINLINDLRPTKVEEVDKFVDILQRFGEMLLILESVQMLEEFMDSFNHIKKGENIESQFSIFLSYIKMKFPIRYANIPQYLLHYN